MCGLRRLEECVQLCDPPAQLRGLPALFGNLGGTGTQLDAGSLGATRWLSRSLGAIFA